MKSITRLCQCARARVMVSVDIKIKYIYIKIVKAYERPTSSETAETFRRLNVIYLYGALKAGGRVFGRHDSHAVYIAYYVHSRKPLTVTDNGFIQISRDRFGREQFALRTGVGAIKIKTNAIAAV